MANGLYASDGSLRTTTVPGTSFTGLYAADGSVNIVVDDASHYGPYHPCGAVRTSSTTASRIQDPSGAYYANHILGWLSGSSVPGWVLAGAVVDMDFANNQFFGGSAASLISSGRSSTATDLLPTSASGYVYKAVVGTSPIISPGVGLLVYRAATNLLLNSSVPVTQTTASLGTGAYTLWVNGSGSALASNGTATIVNAAPVTNGAPNIFTVNVAGTVTVTVTGSLNFFQLETGSYGTPGIITVAATATRTAEVITPLSLAATLLQGTTGSVVIATNLIQQAGGNHPRLVGAQAGGPAFASWIDYGESGTLKMSTYNGVTLLTTSNAVTIASPTKSGLSWDLSSRALAANGTAAVTDAGVWNPSGITPQLGGGDGTQAETIDGVISRITMFSTKLSPSALTAFTV